jgi:uncharacterized membrane protein
VIYQWGLYILAVFFIVAGLNHFRVPKVYLRIMPPYLPMPEKLNLLAGLAEVIAGVLLLIPSLQFLGAVGIVLILIAVTPVHIYMLQERRSKFAQIPAVILWLRLPLQLVLIWWAAIYI